MTRNFTTVKDLCAKQGNPYYELSIAENHIGYTLKGVENLTLRGLQTPYVYCGLVENVHTFGRSFLYSQDDLYVFECQSYQNFKKQWLDESIELFIEDRRPDLFQSYIEEECIFIGGTATEPTEFGLSHLNQHPNFGHFIFEYLNRLSIFEYFGLTRDLPIVVYDNLPKRWDGFFELLGISKDRIVRVPILETPAFRKVWVSSSCHYRDSAGKYRLWASGIHWFRFRMLSAIGDLKLSDHRRIYIGRGDAQWRKMANEDKVIELLSEYGFEFPDMAQLSAREQIETVCGADIVVTAAGAGTVITQFAPEHCTIIALIPKETAHGPFGGLGAAAVLRQKFERLDCEFVPENKENHSGELTDRLERHRKRRQDYIADLDALKKTIDLAISHIESNQVRDAAQL